MKRPNALTYAQLHAFNTKKYLGPIKESDLLSNKNWFEHYVKRKNKVWYKHRLLAIIREGKYLYTGEKTSI